MSTRATYEINGHAFYIHHDGYPAGAAMYLNNAINFTSESPNARLQDDFIRANSRAEMVDSHESYGDTEYRYTITTTGNKHTVRVFARIDYGTEWDQVYFGSLETFIERNPELIEVAA